MSLRHALLALLEACPMTGYELAKEFAVSAGYVWHAQRPHIYTELRRMESDGLVEGADAPRGVAGTKRRYFLTDAGCAELLRWLEEQSEPPRERDGALLRATYLEFGSFATARRHYRAHLEHYRRVAAHWQAHADQLERRDTALMRRRLAHAPGHAHNAIVAYKVHVYRGLTERARTEIRWAEQGLRLVERLERDTGLAEDAPVSPPRPPLRKPHC